MPPSDSPSPSNDSQSPPDDSPSEAAPSNRSRRWFPIVARLAVAVIVIAALWHAIENLRGKRAWASAEAHLADLEIPLTLSEAIKLARPVPDGPNFCDLPMVAALRQFSVHPEKGLIFDQPQLVLEFDSLQLPLKPGEMPDFGSISLQQPTDLQAWAAWFKSPAAETSQQQDAQPLDEVAAAEQILSGLSGAQWVYQSLLEAATYSGYAAFPAYLDGDESLPELVALPLPEVSRLLHVGDAIHLRGLAELALSNPDAALAALTVLQRLGEALRSGPTLIHAVNASYLDEACLHLMRDGLRRSSWSADHLPVIRELLSRIQPRQHLHQTLVIELNATVIIGCNYFKTHRSQFATLSGGRPDFDPRRSANPPAGLLWNLLMPRGWLDQNKAHAARLLADHAIIPLRTSQTPELVPPSALAQSPYQMFTSMILIGHLESVLFATDAATWLALSDTALAIRQFELRHGQAPRNLDALVAAGLLPQIPVDPWSLEQSPLTYVIGGTDHGTVWRLYSVGVDPNQAPHAAHRPEWIGSVAD